jgi:drug/metabolite transporter (DMT)-like permease
MGAAALSGLVWVALAPVFYAAMSSSAKLAGAHLSVWQIGVGRFVLGLVLVPILVRCLGLSLWGKQRFLLTLRGLCGATGFLLLVASFQRIPLSLAMVLFYLYPAFTALLSPLLTGEPTGKRAWPFIIGAFAGTTLILWPEGSGTARLGLGHLYAMSGSVLCAVTLLLVRRLGKDNNIYTLFYYLCLAGTLASLGPMLFQKAPLVPGEPVAWIHAAAVAVFSVGAQLSINQALIHIPAPKVSVMMTAEVPLVACFGVIWLGEPMGWRLVVGALLIFCCGIVLNVLPGRATSTGETVPRPR